jgi:hypothetical protein
MRVIPEKDVRLENPPAFLLGAAEPTRDLEPRNGPGATYNTLF